MQMIRCPLCGSRQMMHAYDGYMDCISCHWHTIKPPVKIVFTYQGNRVNKRIEYIKAR